jgi:hypothetical protein
MPPGAIAFPMPRFGEIADSAAKQWISHKSFRAIASALNLILHHKKKGKAGASSCAKFQLGVALWAISARRSLCSRGSCVCCRLRLFPRRLGIVRSGAKMYRSTMIYEPEVAKSWFPRENKRITPPDTCSKSL